MAEVVVFGDWDADGVASAALVVYGQEYKAVFPLKGKHSVDYYPCDPGSALKAVENVGDAELVVFVDVPFSKRVKKALQALGCKGKKVVFIDHHLSSFFHMDELRELVMEAHVAVDKCTAEIIADLLATRGVKLTPRLEGLVKAVSYMDRGLRAPEQYKGLLNLARMVSRALTHTRDPELWRGLVKWFSSPLSSVVSPALSSVVEKMRRASGEEDVEAKEKALELAFTARNIGYIKFVDARRAWRRRGAIALTTRLYRTLKAPVAVLVENKKGDPILIVKTRYGGAVRVARQLKNEGIAEDIGGHAALAVLKLKKPLDMKKLEDALRKASFKL